jgi:hypothetical protein
MEPDTAQAKRRRLEELAAEARHARDRHRLYRAKVHGPGLTSPGRLREFERVRNLAESKLRRAQSERSSDLGSLNNSNSER